MLLLAINMLMIVQNIGLFVELLLVLTIFLMIVICLSSMVVMMVPHVSAKKTVLNFSLPSPQVGEFLKNHL